MTRWTARDVLRVKPKNKFNARKKVVDGIEFDSTKEARTWQDLALMQKAGQITELKRQQAFPIVVNGIHVCTYVCDFTFMRDAKLIVADAKGMRTDIYKLKRKLLKAAMGIEIEEM